MSDTPVQTVETMETPAIVEQPIVIHGPITGIKEPDAPSSVVIAPATVTVADTAPATLVATRTNSAPDATTSVVIERAMGLDAFRGFLLLAMNFAFTIPEWGPFPRWMYHTQNPPPGDYVNIAGLTWRDMTFPGFLFTMAAALPVVMGARLAKGMPYPEILWIALRRAALLMIFALVIGHVNPFWTHDETSRGNVVAITGLLVCFAYFLRPPRTWNPTFVTWFRRAATVAVAAVLFALPLMYGQHFSIERNDDIIWSIAFCTVAGTVIWLATRFHPKARIALLAAVIVARVATQYVGPIGDLWNYTPAPWLYQPWYLELLVIVIPGTIAGDLLARWMRRGADSLEAWSTQRLLGIVATALATIPVLLVGLYHRQNTAFARIGVTLLAGALVAQVQRPRTERDRVIARLCVWAAVWLTIGAIVEPYEGGIRKDPQTLGYLTLMAGVAYAGFTAMLIVVDALRAGKRVLKPLAEIGQNPLFAYVVYFLGIEHVLWLTGLGETATKTWPVATVRAFVLTAIVGGLVWLTTRAKLLWRT